MKCDVCGAEFERSKQMFGHKSVHSRIIQPKKELTRGDRKFSCRFCGKEFDKKQSLGGHAVQCPQNPNRCSYLKRKSEKMIGSQLPHSTRNSIRETINRKIKNGEWHNSFSKSRIHTYKGIKFHGTWEVEFAKYLDSMGIRWRRVTESFLYEFQGRFRRYTPDFYLIDDACYVEIKGYETEKDRAKWSQFPFNLKILKGKELKDMGIIQDYREVSK